MSIIRFSKIATPADAPSGKVELFADTSDGLVKQIDDAGVVTPLALSFTPEDVANKKTTTTLGSSDTFYPTQKAVKTYVDNAISALASVYEALLGYTPEDVANKTTDGTLAGNSDTLYPSEKAVKTYVDSKPAGGTKLDINTSGFFSPNNTSENTVYSVTVPGGSLGSSNGVRVKLYLDRLDNNSANLTLRFKYGSTTLITIAVDNGANSLMGGIIEFTLLANGGASSQMGLVFASLIGDGYAGGSATRNVGMSVSGSSSETSSSNQTLAITCQVSAGTQYLFDVFAVVAEFIK